MGCPCRKAHKKVNAVSDSKVNSIKLATEGKNVKGSDMARLVNFEGQLVPHNSIPQGSLYIGGVWYSSPDKMPEEIRKKYNDVYSGWKNTANSNTEVVNNK
jgi:hypothetical protein